LINYFKSYASLGDDRVFVSPCTWKSGYSQAYIGCLTNRIAPQAIAIGSCSNSQVSASLRVGTRKKILVLGFVFCEWRHKWGSFFGHFGSCYLA